MIIEGINQITIGDALTILPKLDSQSVQSMIADPPYFNVLEENWDNQWENADDYIDWSLAWIGQCMRILNDDGILFCFGQVGKREHTFIHLMSEVSKKFQFHDLIIWDRAVGYDRRDSFSPAYEMILVLKKSGNVKFIKDAVRIPYKPEVIKTYLTDKRYKDKEARMEHLQKGKFATNILRVPSLKGSSKEKSGHPSQKPLSLIEKLVICSSEPNEIVLDPFLGSGTTAVAAEKNGRHWIGIEKDESYVEIANRRLNGKCKTRQRKIAITT